MMSISRWLCAAIARTDCRSGHRRCRRDAPYQAGMSDLSATLGLAQLKRLDEILERRRFTEHLYYTHIQSFEGIKDRMWLLK